ncbi:MAG: HEAT repeat domain-containing protein [Myxococcales bacterium]|nr:HEAT repeat domain-containing protein [Myxococcales bacterium]MCB9708416.1 HEAT repeat domain-containing protein [Myxococcales bacterium]
MSTAWSLGATAEDVREDFLVKKLHTSSHFRVRAQAALSLARIEFTPSIVRALSVALDDPHPAVRAAAAVALKDIGDRAALPALERATRDSDMAVRRAAEQAVRSLEREEPQARGPARFYVGIGTPGSNVKAIQGSLLMKLKQQLTQRIASIGGVRIAPGGETEAQARSLLRRKKLVGYYVDSSVVKIERCPEQGVRAEVSVVLSTYPDHDIRAMLSGAARVSGSGDFVSMRQQAIEGAFSGALKRLPQAMEQASEGR